MQTEYILYLVIFWLWLMGLVSYYGDIKQTVAKEDRGKLSHKIGCALNAAFWFIWMTLVTALVLLVKIKLVDIDKASNFLKGEKDNDKKETPDN